MKGKAGLIGGPVPDARDENFLFRLDRSHANTVESIFSFVAPAMLAIMLGVGPGLLAMLVWVFLAIRVAYSIVYLRGGALGKGGSLRTVLHVLGIADDYRPHRHCRFGRVLGGRKMHLAELNIAVPKYPLDDPRIADFVDNLARINDLAATMPGYVWMHKDETRQRFPPADAMAGRGGESDGLGISRTAGAFRLEHGPQEILQPQSRMV